MYTIPAIIPKNLEDLENKLSYVGDSVPYVQIDICDGRLTPVGSWPYFSDREKVFDKILGQEQGMPSWDVFDFEIDLMVLNPMDEYEKWLQAGASRIVIHHKTLQPPEKNIFALIRERGVEVGMAFHVGDPLSWIEDLVDEIDFVQFMGIKRIGFQGEPFDHSVLENIKAIKAKFPDLVVSVDGGVNFDTAPLIAEAGADRVVVGSALFNHGDIRGAVDYFESL